MRTIDIDSLMALGIRAAALLKARNQTVAVGETSSGGLISASLLSVPGASAYYVGGAITYSGPSIEGLAGISLAKMQADGIRSSSEQYAQLLANAVRSRHGNVTWGVSETGAAGPQGNVYGDPPGHTCMGVAGPVSLTRTLRTGSADRITNMQMFAEATLMLFIEALQAVD